MNQGTAMLLALGATSAAAVAYAWAFPDDLTPWPLFATAAVIGVAASFIPSVRRP